MQICHLNILGVKIQTNYFITKGFSGHAEYFLHFV